MNAIVFNACLLLGWLLLSAGAWMVSPRLGLVVAGAVLLLLTVFVARVAGVYSTKD